MLPWALGVGHTAFSFPVKEPGPHAPPPGPHPHGVPMVRTAAPLPENSTEGPRGAPVTCWGGAEASGGWGVCQAPGLWLCSGLGLLARSPDRWKRAGSLHSAWYTSSRQ